GDVTSPAALATLERTARHFLALFAVREGGSLAGIGGLTGEPMPDDGAPALRLRRVYVHPDARRRGVGRTIATAIIQEGLDSARRLTVHTDDSRAEAFWQAQGFTPVSGKAWNLEFRG
ncbi:MAG: GNAT family N-acetyltransferase, partial [Phenylobacterium sp.]